MSLSPQAVVSSQGGRASSGYRSQSPFAAGRDVEVSTSTKFGFRGLPSTQDYVQQILLQLKTLHFSINNLLVLRKKSG
jgi:hypothetical protein